MSFANPPSKVQCPRLRAPWFGTPRACSMMTEFNCQNSLGAFLINAIAKMGWLDQSSGVFYTWPDEQFFYVQPTPS